MSSIERQMIKYINIARQQPSYFISVLEKQIKRFINDKQMPLTEQVIYETNQGISAWREALKFLQSQKPLSPLQQHSGLSMSANTHAKDLAKNRIFGHTGSDGSSFSQRILRYCKKGHGSMAELIGADFNLQNRNHAQMTILGLLVDDGVMDRGHRKTIFNPSYHYIGCQSEIQGQKLITVFNLTENNLVIRGQSNNQSASSKFGNKDTFNCDQNTFYQTDFNLKNPKTTDSPKLVLQNISNPNNQSGVHGFTSPKNGNNHPENKLSRISSKPETVKNDGNRKICEKNQSSKVYYKEGTKITEIVTQFIYSDGTIEEKTHKNTVYL